FWMRVVHCYELGAYKDQTLKGKTNLRFQISRAGKVVASRELKTTLKDREVSACFATEMRKVEFPAARSSSIVTPEVQISPGDDAMPPPASVIVPGDGTIDPERALSVVRESAPAFELCYKAALDYAPLLWGRLGIRFHLTDKGKLDEAFEAESRFPD